MDVIGGVEIDRIDLVDRLKVSSTLHDPALIDGEGTRRRRVPHNRQENQ